MKRMVERVAEKAKDIKDESLENVETAIDAIIAGIQTIDENVDGVTTVNVPEKAALDTLKEIMDEAITPYMGDIVKAMDVFSRLNSTIVGQEKIINDFYEKHI